MKENIMCKIIALITVLSFGIGCGGPKNLTPDPSEKVVKKIPDWYLEVPEDSNYLYSAATMTGRDLQVSVQKATTAARTSLAQQFGVRVENLTKQFQEEIGVNEGSEFIQHFSSASKTVADEMLRGSHIEKKEIQPEKEVYRAYVLMRLPLGKANKMLLDEIKKNNALYSKFRATQAYEELDKEIGKQQSE
jgi:hypothetical protein